MFLHYFIEFLDINFVFGFLSDLSQALSDRAASITIENADENAGN